MSLLHDLEKIPPESEEKTIKRISKEIIQFYVELEKDESFNSEIKEKLLNKVINGETTFSKELKEMGIDKFRKYGDMFYSINLFDYNLNILDFKKQIREKVAILDRIITSLYRVV